MYTEAFWQEFWQEMASIGGVIVIPLGETTPYWDASIIFPVWEDTMFNLIGERAHQRRES